MVIKLGDIKLLMIIQSLVLKVLFFIMLRSAYFHVRINFLFQNVLVFQITQHALIRIKMHRLNSIDCNWHVFMFN